MFMIFSKTVFSYTRITIAIILLLVAVLSSNCAADRNNFNLKSAKRHKSQFKCSTWNCQSLGASPWQTRSASGYVRNGESGYRSETQNLDFSGLVNLQGSGNYSYSDDNGHFALTAQSHAPVQNSDTIYNDFTQEYYYPNGTDAIHPEASNVHYFTNDALGQYYPEEVAVASSPANSVDKDGSEIKGGIIIETNAAKLKLIAASIWSLIIVAVLTINYYLLDPSFSICGGPNDEHLPIWYFNANNPDSYFTAHEDESLQKDLFGMFKYSHFDNSDEDFSSEMPDLSPVSSMCPRNAFFYGMNHQHMQAVEMVKDILMDQGGPHDVMSMAKAMRQSPHVNPKVWYVALMKTSHERSDMAGMQMPGPLDAMPDTFIPGDSFARAISYRREGRSHKKGEKCVRVDGNVGVDNGIENLLWYFREDVMVNSHHWYWHLSFPLMSKIDVDRRGELFYYSHRSMTARYNIERLCNGLEFVQPLDIYPGAPIPDGYNAHLTDTNSGMHWTDREPFVPFSDIMHQENHDSPLVIELEPWLRSRDRLLKSIDSGFFITPHGKRRIPHYEGISMLGNTLEAIDRSVNPMYYSSDGFHNSGHRIIGLSVDPNYYLKLPPGPMGDPATAMRDPVFYRWHTNVNDVFERYKRTLKPYRPIGGSFPLLWKGVEVKKINVVAKGHRINDLNTFWVKRKFELSLGLAFNRTQGDEDDDDKPDHLKVCAAHLDHEEFQYEIVVDRKPCAHSHSSKATVRVFLAPRYNLHGHQFTIQEQRRLFVHLDLFTATLETGRNVISRRSIDSTLTIPFTRSIRQLQENQRNSPNCGCGWPHHLLLPKGSPDGMWFDLFVMITNGDEDYVADDNAHSSWGQCGSAFLYCGIPNRKFPDSKPMGYPFDREIHQSLWHRVLIWIGLRKKTRFVLEEYMSGISNMGSAQVLITHIDTSQSDEETI